MALRTAKQYKLQHDWPENALTPDLELLFDAFDEQIFEFVCSVIDFTNITKPEVMAAEILNIFLLSRGFRVANDFPNITLTETEKRKLAVLALPLYRQKGTAPGIVNIIRLLLGIETAVLTQYNVNVWKVGESLLGDTTVLFPDTSLIGSSRVLYTFDIQLLQAATADEVQKIRDLAEFMKPIHTHLNLIIQPVIIDHWELNISEVNDTTDLH